MLFGLFRPDLLFSFECDENLQVMADQTRLKQVILNLLTNAIKYNKPDGIIFVTVDIDEENQTTRITVCDNGIGIAKENQDKIFDRFYRAEDSNVQRIPGTGLGLAIVRSLVEMHGGRLKVESKLGIGSTFTFNLPVVIEDSDPT